MERPNLSSWSSRTAALKLVLTDRDFGLGYLADGWATRFLMEMFREFAVLFVGYSHSDPVIEVPGAKFRGRHSQIRAHAERPR